MSVQTHRSAEEIGRTEIGPRPLPPLGEQRPPTGLSTEDTTLSNGLRVIVVKQSGVPMVELRLRIPFADTDLTLASLAGASLRKTTLSGLRFREANLTGADLRDCDLTGTDLRGARLLETKLAGADLRGAQVDANGLRQAALSGARVDIDTAIAFAAAHGLQVGE